MRLTPEELAVYMRHWDEPIRRVIQERLATRDHLEYLTHFTPDEAEMLRAILARMIPQPAGEEVDLVGFLDWAIDKPVGGGRHTQAVPPVKELIHAGIIGVQETSVREYGEAFTELSEEQQDHVLMQVQEGAVSGMVWERVPSQVFFTQLMMQTLTGYCAHPLAWLRMGYPGASYPEGYTWARHTETPLRRPRRQEWKHG